MKFSAYAESEMKFAHIRVSEYFTFAEQIFHSEAISLARRANFVEKSTCFRKCFFLVAGMGFEPHDLRVMSPTSYRTALPRDIEFLKNGAGNRARTGTGFKSHGILSPGRLPIPPLRHIRSEPSNK